MSKLHTTHELKCWPEFYRAIVNGDKPFDLRKNDRRFRAGDRVVLREFDDRTGKYTGMEIEKRVTFVLDGIGGGCIPPLQGLMRGYCILGLGPFVEFKPREIEEPKNDAPNDVCVSEADG